MRIGIDARFLGDRITGLARYSENLLEALARLDTHNDYVVFVSSRLHRKIRLRPNFRLVPMAGNPLALNSMFRIARAVRREKLDLLHVHFPSSPPFLDCPVLITVHDILPFASGGATTRYRIRFIRWLWSYVLYSMTLARSRWIVCVSDATRESLCVLFPELRHKTIVVHSGVEEFFRQPVEAATLELIRARLSLPRRYILYSGSLREEKNVVGVLRAFARLRQRRPDLADLHLMLEVTAQEQEVEQIRRVARQFEIADRLRIVREAKDDERRAIFEDARLLLVLSRQEGFCFPILQAQLCGLPGVAADDGSIPEIAGEDGALLVDPDRLDETVDLVERALEDEGLRSWLTSRGRRNAERFQWGNTAERIVQLYDHLFYPRSQVERPPRQGLAALVARWLEF